MQELTKNLTRIMKCPKKYNLKLRSLQHNKDMRQYPKTTTEQLITKLQDILRIRMMLLILQLFLRCIFKKE